VIVQQGRIIGRGFTQAGGRPHAETEALAQAGAAARGATAYVSLEPCAHHGHTPPCAQALVQAGISRVVVALTDPDPRVAGRGLAMLRAAGIDVCEAVMQAEARQLNAGFLLRINRARPLVTLKLALSLDGKIATASGASRWITGPEARRAVHAMRARHDAVMVGIGTALADDPDLTVRDLGVARQPLRIVIDSQLRLPASSRLTRSAASTPVWLCHVTAKTPAAPLQGIVCASDAAGRVEITDALTRLAERGLTRIFCEGGGALAASLLAANLVDELVCISAGRVFGDEGRSAIAALPRLEAVPPGPEFHLVEHRNLGGDVMHHWRRAPLQ